MAKHRRTCKKHGNPANERGMCQDCYREAAEKRARSREADEGAPPPAPLKTDNGDDFRTPAFTVKGPAAIVIQDLVRGFLSRGDAGMKPVYAGLIGDQLLGAVIENMKAKPKGEGAPQ